MANTREELRDILMETPYLEIMYNIDEAVDYLIDNGVTVSKHTKDQPTTDVVKHAKWVNGFCSICRVLNPTSRLNEWTLEFEESYLPYCPNCGAKMDGKDTNVPTK